MDTKLTVIDNVWHIIVTIYDSWQLGIIWMLLFVRWILEDLMMKPGRIRRKFKSDPLNFLLGMSFPLLGGHAWSFIDHQLWFRVIAATWYIIWTIVMIDDILSNDKKPKFKWLRKAVAKLKYSFKAPAPIRQPI